MAPVDLAALVLKELDGMTGEGVQEFFFELFNKRCGYCFDPIDFNGKCHCDFQFTH